MACGRPRLWPETPKPGQERVLAAICSDQRDCVAVMPTGGGKTLCYELPAVVAWAKGRKVTVVVTMLRELVWQQTETLKKRHGPLFAAHSLREDDESSTPDAEPQLEPEDPAADESGDELPWRTRPSRPRVSRRAWSTRRAASAWP